jgi:hypothetical protein
VCKGGGDNAADDYQTHVTADMIRGQAGIIFGASPTSNFWRISQQVDTESTYFSSHKIGCGVTKMASKAKTGFIR